MNVDVARLPDLIEQMIGGAGWHAMGDADLQREFLGVPGKGLLLGKLESVGRDRDEIGIVDEGQLQMKTRLQRPLLRTEHLAEPLDEGDVCRRDHEIRAGEQEYGNGSDRGRNDPVAHGWQGGGGEDAAKTWLLGPSRALLLIAQHLMRAAI